MKITLQPHSHQYGTIQYPGGERQVRLLSGTVAALLRLAEERCEVDLVARIYNSQDIIDLCLLNDAIRGVDDRLRVHCWMPYLPYARADRRFTPGDCFGLAGFAIILNAMGFESVIAWDPHSDEAAKRINRMLPQSAEPFIEQAVVDFWKENGKQPIAVLFPDAGAAKRYKPRDHYGCNTVLIEPLYHIAEKKRDAATGKFEGFTVPVLSRPTLIVDDICDGGGTFLGIANAARVNQAAIPPLGLYTTHGIYSKGFDEICVVFDQLYCAGTYKESYDQPGPKVFPVVINADQGQVYA